MSGSDKKIGVVGLTMFDLRRRGKVDKLSMVGTSGSKFPAIRESPDTKANPCSFKLILLVRSASAEEHFVCI